MSKGNEDCVRTKGLEGLNDVDCEIKGAFVCEGYSKYGKFNTDPLLYSGFKIILSVHIPGQIYYP